MKPKTILRAVTITLAAATLIFLETARQAHMASNKSISAACNTTSKFRVSNNDFIFFESISKYLFVSFR